MLHILTKPQANKIRWMPVEIDGKKLEVKIIESRRASKLTLNLIPLSNKSRRLSMTVPPRTPVYAINNFLNRSKNWAAVRLAKLPRLIAIEDGVKIPLRGKLHRVVHNEGRGIVEALEEDGEKIIKVFGNECFLPRKVQDFLKREAKSDLQVAVAHYAELLDVRPKSITVRDTITRWGSCSVEGALNFSWRMIFAPPKVLDYLAAHEVAHLLEMNHSKRFWNLVKKVCPDYEVHRMWLRNNGTKLHCIAPN